VETTDNYSLRSKNKQPEDTWTSSQT